MTIALPTICIQLSTPPAAQFQVQAESSDISPRLEIQVTEDQTDTTLNPCPLSIRQDGNYQCQGSIEQKVTFLETVANRVQSGRVYSILRTPYLATFLFVATGSKTGCRQTSSQLARSLTHAKRPHYCCSTILSSHLTPNPPTHYKVRGKIPIMDKLFPHSHHIPPTVALGLRPLCITEAINWLLYVGLHHLHLSSNLLDAAQPPPIVRYSGQTHLSARMLSNLPTVLVQLFRPFVRRSSALAIFSGWMPRYGNSVVNHHVSYTSMAHWEKLRTRLSVMSMLHLCVHHRHFYADIESWDR